MKERDDINNKLVLTTNNAQVLKIESFNSKQRMYLLYQAVNKLSGYKIEQAKGEIKDIISEEKHLTYREEN